MTIDIDSGATSALVQIFDASGQQLADQEVRDELGYFYDASALVFVIDPLSIPAVAEQFSPGEMPDHVSNEHPEASFHQVVNFVRESGGFAGRRYLAVVISKSDLLFDAGIEFSPESDGIVEWLREVGLASLVDGASMAFDSVGWFSAVSIGPVPADSPYNASRALDWLLNASGLDVVLADQMSSGNRQ